MPWPAGSGWRKASKDRSLDMSANHKLTGVIKGRKINGTGNSRGRMAILFTDGSRMTVKTAGVSNGGSTGGTVKGVRHTGTELNLDFEGGEKLTIETAEATSCVMVRDQAGGLGVGGLSG